MTGAGASRLPIAVADFAGEAQTAHLIASVVRGDLERTGMFNLVDTGPAVMDESSTPSYADWKYRGVDMLVAGSVASSG
ncbi:MAG: Tol-Pal system protein TolB, partial [Candidatus Accumulibacter sp.]|nr:Tol-Pal system protein TolB [Accumulibacter sp.]